MDQLLTTPLDTLHREFNARMVPFAGYSMPVQYPDGIIKEHLHTRDQAGLFDVSHMGQVVVTGPNVTASLEALLPADLVALPEHHSVYSLLMNDQGGVRDDLIVTRWGDDRFFMVINAACKHDDLDYLRSAAPELTFSLLEDRALLALQGPAARPVMARLMPEAANLVFMTGAECEFDGVPLYVTCSGYTGEDGFELSIPAAHAERVARALLDQPEVAPVGLGARDSLRLEAGLCLYGHELATDITPVEAGLRWAIAAARRPGAERAGGYPGADVVAQQMADGPTRRRVGLKVLGTRPVREGQSVLNDAGDVIGSVCSGAFGPSVEAPVAMAYVDPAFAAVDTELAVDVRGKSVTVQVVKMPLVPSRYHRG
jgi:aminomethyltransferase